MKKKLLQALIALVLVALMAYLGRKYYDQLPRLLEVTWPMLLLITALFMLMRVFMGEVYREALRALDIRIGHYEAFMLAMIVSMTNLLLPRMGMGAPALYLKARHRVPIADFVALLLPTTVLQVACLGIIGLLCQGYLWRFAGLAWDWRLATALGGMTLVSLLCLLEPMHVPERWHGRLAEFLRRFLRSWSILRASPRLVLYILLLQAAVLVTQALRLWACFWALGQPVSLPAVTLASFLGQIGSLIGYTPGGLGFREGGIGLGAAMMGVDVDTAVSAGLLDRAVMTVAVVVLGQIGAWQFIRPVMAGQWAAPPPPASTPAARQDRQP